MRQPDNLPAFCRVHRNGRKLIGIVRALAEPVSLNGLPSAAGPFLRGWVS
jgi:hypothetical protein